MAREVPSPFERDVERLRVAVYPAARVEKHFRAFVAEVYVRHGYGPTLGQSHDPCDLCRSIANARALLATLEGES